ncbi:MAG TPA: capsule assembly Wzi family protein [Methylibium sp.]|uniref:capsule assembly Wzi family protein n=1 Tax=Methylibium sp. TaxID=2067992 RepID=UPI002DC0320C|nr:capsule assembly Wzi family protein [Methylibium sp.]HEU4460551.1 capsule assembly Wzi family protein [Methylibium sp.]
MPSNNKLASRKLALLLVASIASTIPVAAQAAAPVLIDGAEFGLRDDLAWLADRGRIGLGLTTWPQPLGVIEKALDRVRADELEEADRDALARARSALQRLRGGAAVGAKLNTARHPSAGGDGVARGRAEGYAQIAGTGLSTDPAEAEGASTAWRLRARASEGRLARDPSPLGLDGSYLAWGGDAAVLSLGALDRWWGGGRTTGTLLTDAAAPVPTLSLRRGNEDAPSWPWLAWIGPWSYELSIGRMTHYQPRGTNLIGMRLVARPIEGLEIGAGRMIYWGGSGRSRSAGSLADAVLGRSNIDDPALQGDDPSNEVAGVDLRYTHAFRGFSLGGHMQLAGEDEAGYFPSKQFATVGLQLKHASERWRFDWSLEGTDTRLSSLFGLDRQRGLSAYQHFSYTQGHYHQGLPVGAAVGGGGTQATLMLGLVPVAAPDERRYELRLWQAEVSRNGFEPINAAYGVPGTIHGALVQASGEWRATSQRLRWNLGVSVQDRGGDGGVEPGRRRAGLVGSIELPLGGR